MSLLMRVDDLIHQCKNCKNTKDIILQIQYLNRTKTDIRKVYMNGQYYIADGIIYFEVAKNLKESEKEKINNQDFIDIIEKECINNPKDWGNLYRSPMDMIEDLEIKFINNFAEYESEDYSISHYDIQENNILIVLKQEIGIDVYNMKDIVTENLENIKRDVDENEHDYEIYADMSEFPEIVWLGETYKERLQILVMLYYHEPKLKELKETDIEQLFNYIKETDEYWEKDRKIFEKCMYIITEKLL